MGSLYVYMIFLWLHISIKLVFKYTFQTWTASTRINHQLHFHTLSIVKQTHFFFLNGCTTTNNCCDISIQYCVCTLFHLNWTRVLPPNTLWYRHQQATMLTFLLIFSLGQVLAPHSKTWTSTDTKTNKSNKHILYLNHQYSIMAHCEIVTKINL